MAENVKTKETKDYKKVTKNFIERTEDCISIKN